MARGIKRLVARAHKNVSRQIQSDHDQMTGLYGCLAGEGYNGGYRAALDDVILALNGNLPLRNGWWDPPEKERE